MAVTNELRALLLTGLGKHSLAEAFADRYCTRLPNSLAVGIDLAPSNRLAARKNLRTLSFDLNPLALHVDYREFGPRFRD